MNRPSFPYSSPAATTAADKSDNGPVGSPSPGSSKSRFKIAIRCGTVIFFLCQGIGCGSSSVYGVRSNLPEPTQLTALRTDVAVHGLTSPSTFGFTPTAWQQRLSHYHDAFMRALQAQNVRATPYTPDTAPPPTTSSDDPLLNQRRQRYRITNWRIPALRQHLPFSLLFEPDPNTPDDAPLRIPDQELLNDVATMTTANSYLVFQVLYHSWHKCRETYCVVATVEFKWIDLRTRQILWYSRGQAESTPDDPDTPNNTPDNNTEITLGDPPFSWKIPKIEQRVIEKAVDDALFGPYKAPKILEKR